MRSEADARVCQQIEALYRSDSRRVLATLIRLLGSFDAAEEALHDAFTAALGSWPGDGVPENPCAWLISTGRFKVIDRLRRRARFNAALAAAAEQLEANSPPGTGLGGDGLEDDRLRLIFTCATQPSPRTPASRSRCRKCTALRQNRSNALS
jgi:RNA polymerase sigma-70 factor (ECF subfamily)